MRLKLTPFASGNLTCPLACSHRKWKRFSWRHVYCSWYGATFSSPLISTLMCIRIAPDTADLSVLFSAKKQNLALVSNEDMRLYNRAENDSRSTQNWLSHIKAVIIISSKCHFKIRQYMKDKMTVTRRQVMFCRPFYAKNVQRSKKQSNILSYSLKNSH